ncbi:MAG: metalloregulator ArsR/SmtB family transcription factor [Clostridia bacterium]|jgi:ArsR family transcriptional regulator|nr:metalloregulator ArsR/SmtB family transcription factor [Clostridia bacterium]NLV33865.1 metalloregulator ArsR/SmtB family transcription factor [Clostridiaceae bacterium]HPB18028.1 metalloregulator ArsR/SmtB family transcription factor [Clostridia bacterium]HQM97070.1 metalloregulator ArsR/SmtB family transcription factor [Clostridia bacterium]HQO70317.1 metalloregulator ArsR/SmtB family transcription factor [Clostridia bacterium]
MEEQFDICDYINMKEEEVKEVIRNIPSEDKLYNLSDLFKVFGDKTRIKVLYALSVTEMCVCDIARLTEMTQSAISHQLKTLKASKLVKYRKEGKATFYSLADDHVKTILEQGKNHIEE